MRLLGLRVTTEFASYSAKDNATRPRAREAPRASVQRQHGAYANVTGDQMPDAHGDVKSPGERLDTAGAKCLDAPLAAQ